MKILKCVFETKGSLSSRCPNEQTHLAIVSNTSGLVLSSLAQALEFLAAATLTGLFVIGFAAHFLAQSAPLAKFAEAADRLLDGLSGTNP
jgi:hypothetical protein